MTTCLLATLAGSPAWAQTSPYYVGGIASVTREDNLLRLGDGQAAPSGLSKSDTISSLALTGGVDQPIGRQRVFGNVTLRESRFAENDVYDNRSYALNAGLDFATVERVSGNLRLGATRRLAQFNTDTLGLVTEKNEESTRRIDATVRVGVVTRWSFEAGAGHRSIDYSSDAYASRVFNQDHASLGIRYRPQAASSFALTLRDARGRYPRSRIDPVNGGYDEERFDRRDLDLEATLQPSAASRLLARLSYGDIDYELLDARDFRGVTGLLSWDWRPTAKLAFDTRLTRDPSQDAYFADSELEPERTVEYSRITDALRLGVNYLATSKVSLSARLALWRRSTIANDAGVTLRDTERGNAATLGLSWSPTRTLLVGCEISRERRRGDGVLSQDMTAKSASCQTRLTLQ
ncbi:hypothetical protein CLD22_25590 [Rubrivivax gelatinosus]|uniref:Beta-barrel porin 2 n=1 Tax=Rubrivivax gelatinosus TaxID=28068 RepID=A0ABS1DVC0_RUBGE|nr:hypothetical protein [Rubrivivax gelatinosus]MBZ8143227.1 hypothetical protein [Rubrivivax gelatinosus]